MYNGDGFIRMLYVYFMRKNNFNFVCFICDVLIYLCKYRQYNYKVCFKNKDIVK